jgi:hypothetical protein
MGLFCFEGVTVNTLGLGGCLFVSAYADLVEGTVRIARALVLALINCAVD